MEAWDVPVEGVPLWMKESLLDWLHGRFIYYEGGRDPNRQVLLMIERNCQINLDWGLNPSRAHESLLEVFGRQPEKILDVIDYALANISVPDGAQELDLVLDEVGSVWEVALDLRGLQRRIRPEATEAVKKLMTGGSKAVGEHLAAAWRHIYGRKPDPDAGYDQAVKAVEAAAFPIIIPNNPKATLGKANSAIREAPAGKYTSVLKDGGGVDAILGVMELLWKNQPRHGKAGAGARTVSPAQAEAALHTALMLLQWFERGFLTNTSGR